MLLLALAAPASIRADPAVPRAPLMPMPEKWQQAFQAVRDDRPPPHLVRQTHYVVSNENRHFLFQQAVANQGGVYLGVGSDQNYVLAGWSKPEVMVLLDFDQVVVDLHRVYRLAFLNAPDPASFLKLWGKDGDEQLGALIDQAYTDPVLRSGAHRALRISRKLVRRRLLRVKELYAKLGVHSFLDDPEQYRYVADLFRNDRVVMVRGDLTADHSVHDVAAAAKVAGLPVRVMYLSNAERYFGYGPDFKQSMLALPTDLRTVVVRTANYHRGRYEYNVQGGMNFQSWLRDGRTTSEHVMLHWHVMDKAQGISMIDRTPADLPPPILHTSPRDRQCCREAKRQTSPRISETATPKKTG